jgi:hypothetical protein
MRGLDFFGHMLWLAILGGWISDRVEESEALQSESDFQKTAKYLYSTRFVILGKNVCPHVYNTSNNKK